MLTRVKTDSEIEAMRESGAILAAVLDEIEKVIDVGMSGIEIDEMARRETKARGGTTPFLGYGSPPFPGAICFSLNDEVEHGVPRDIELQDGDIVSLDFGVLYKGMISDSGRTIPIGDVAPKDNQVAESD